MNWNDRDTLKERFNMSDDKPRLFKKGDKVTVTYEVSKDQECGSHGPHTYVEAQVEGITIEVLPTDQVLRLGTLTPAPEPKYVPEVGDVFSYGGGLPRECLFVDSNRVVSEVIEPHRSPESWPIVSYNNFVFIRKVR